MFIRHRFFRSLLVILIVFGLVGSACQIFSSVPANIPPTTAPDLPAETTAAEEETPLAEEPAPALEARPQRAKDAQPVFAEFREPKTSQQVSLPSYTVEANLGNVYNPFLLSEAQKERLTRDGFVVTPGSEKEFFTVYEKARYANVPIFVTSDSLLHSYHLLFDKVLRTAETRRFIPLLAAMNQALLSKADQQYQALQSSGASPAWQDAALRTAAFLGVGSRLLDPSASVPAYTQALVDQELALIDSASGIQPSPIFPGYEYGEDYTQYIPRGHYTRSEELQAYFKSMMWYGRMTFRLKTEDPEVGMAETRAALLLIQAIEDSQVGERPALEVWADLYSPTAFFVGRSDDLTVLQYRPVKEQIYGTAAGLVQVADESRLEAFIEAANQLPPPLILGMVINETDDEEEQTKGLRLMGQRFVPDAFIFRQLVYRNVGTPDNRRGLPMGMDLMAAMGSERAYQILDESGQTDYANYPQQMLKVQEWLSGLAVDEWTETLYNAWIYTFYPLIEPAGEGYPAFMRSQAWQDKQLNTSLGSWAELKHDTILYAKQVYAEMGGGPPAPEPVPPRGYVEPAPQFYARLAALTDMTLEGLDSRNLLDDEDRSSLNRLKMVAEAFQLMAEKELRGEPLTQEEYDIIRFYGGELEHLVMASADTDEEGDFARLYMDEDPQAAVIADVATDPDPGGTGGWNEPIVLEEGVGRIHEIHVVVPVIQDDGTVFLQVAKGGVFSYYEFHWPANDRLTDEKWQAMLDSGQAPALPGWTSSYRADEGEYSDLQIAVFEFQKEITNTFWDVAWVEPDFAGPMGRFQTEIEALKAGRQHESRQVIQSQFTSFDLQSETRAVVTTRETWEDQRIAGEYPDFDQPIVARRGPYAIAATYTLELAADGRWPYWRVAGFDYLEAPPAWE